MSDKAVDSGGRVWSPGSNRGRREAAAQWKKRKPEKGALDLNPAWFNFSWSSSPYHWAFAYLMAWHVQNQAEQADDPWQRDQGLFGNVFGALSDFWLWEVSRGAAREYMTEHYAKAHDRGPDLRGAWVRWVDAKSIPRTIGPRGLREGFKQPPPQAMVNRDQHERFVKTYGAGRGFYVFVSAVLRGKVSILFQPVPCSDVAKHWEADDGRLRSPFYELRLEDFLARYYPPRATPPLRFGEPLERVELDSPEFCQTYPTEQIEELADAQETRDRLARIFPGIELPPRGWSCEDELWNQEPLKQSRRPRPSGSPPASLFTS